MKTPCAAALLLSVAAVLLPSHDAFKLPVGARLIRGPSSSPMTSARRTPSTTTLPSFFPKTKALQASDAAVVEGDNSGAGQVWIEPAFHNKLSVRILAVLAGVGFAMKQTGVVVPKLAATYVHLMMYGAGFGSLMYTTFVLGLVMFKNLPRQTFGKLQSKLFPIYFAWSSFTLAMQLLTGSAMGLPVKAMQWLGASLVTSLVNSLFLEPAATKVMFERYALEKQNKKDAPEYKVLAKKFNGLHGMSSLVNLVAVVGGFVHAYYLALLFV